MPRIIKFRAWDREEKVMFVPTLCLDEDINSEFALLVRTYDVMQFTGLKDKNGTEIYEEDIVKAEARDVYQTYYGRILWWKDRWVLSYKSKFDDKETQNQSLSTVLVAEVIGNIHENPELLEKTT